MAFSTAAAAAVTALRRSSAHGSGSLGRVRGFKPSPPARAGKTEKYSHDEIVYGDGHHGLRPGYHYDYEHGPHYLQPEKIPNFWTKFYIYGGLFSATALGIPFFAVWFQQRKLKAA